MLARLLGRRDPPEFVHHPLILDSTGRKLSKSAHDTGIRELRASGLPPETVVGLAAAAVGLIQVPESIPAGSVAALFRNPRGEARSSDTLG